MQLNYDATGHVPQSFEPLPTGWYTVKMVEGLEKPTSKNNGDTYYAAIFEVIGGKFNGRKIFHNFNFKNQNPEAVRIAYDQLAAMCHATGILKVTTMEQLFEKPMMGKVKLKAAVMEKDADGNDTDVEKYEAGNEIKGFKAVESCAPAGAAGGLPEGFGDAGPAAAGGLPAGFTAGVESTPEPAKPATPAAAIPAAAAPVMERKLVMTEKAQGGTAEQFKAHDTAWTDELLVKEGYAQWVEVEAPKPAAPAAPAIPATPAATEPAQAAATAAPAEGDDDTPPWLQNQ